MKKFICIFSCMLMLILGGCSSYERDTSAGEVKKITVNEMQKKLENKETLLSFLRKAGVDIVKI